MSLFSYISFPREFDRSYLINNFDSSKSFLLGEVRGTELEKKYLDMAVKNISEDTILPVPIEQLPMLIEETLKYEPDDTWIYLGDNAQLTDLAFGISINRSGRTDFNNVFTNKFVYDFLASLGLDKRNTYLESRINNMSEEERNDWYRIEKDMRNRTVHHRKQLYDIVKLNIKPGEFLEIYSIYVNQIDGKDVFDFGVPAEVRRINAEEILTSELLDCERNLKIVIDRTK